MAQKQLVTRTVETTKVTALCLDIGTETASNMVFEVSGSYKDKSKLLKTVQTEYETEMLKIVSIVDYEIEESLYGMSLDFFIANATKLNPETRKPLND